MPSCFSLTPKGLAEPAILQDVDVAICNHLGVPVDPEKWVHSWYNTLGLGLAVGLTWDKLREIYHDYPTTLKIIAFLDANYTTNAWKEYKR